jgi:flagellar hook-length control protein FliK
MPEVLQAGQTGEAVRGAFARRAGGTSREATGDAAQDAAASFDAALAALAGSVSIGTAGRSLDDRASASRRNLAVAPRAGGAREEASREVKQAALVDVAQVAADKLASPAALGAVAEADAAQLQEASGARDGGGERRGRDDGGRGDARGTAAREGSVGASAGADRASGLAAKPGTSGTDRAAAESSAAEAGEHVASAPVDRGARGASARSSASDAASAARVGGAGSAQRIATSGPTQGAATVAGTQGTRATAFKKLLEQGQPARRAAEQQQVAQTVAKGLQMLVKEGGGELLLKLRPGELGAVSARVTIQDARVEATFRARTEVARDLLIKSVDELKAALETRGLVVDRIDVRLDAPPEDSASRRVQDDASAAVAGSERARDGSVGDARDDDESQGRDSQGWANSRSEDDRRGTARMPMERAAAVADAAESLGGMGGADERPWTLDGSGARVLDGFEWVA